jgi:hypothetical protein
MKTLRYLVLVAAGLLFIISYNSCKKGPEDPFFSIWSRKHRVVGDWKVTSYQVDYVDSLRQVLKAEVTLGACGQEVDSVVWTTVPEMNFDKDGGFSAKTTILKDTTYDIVNNTAACPDVFIRDSAAITTVLNWNFTGKIGDVKNKEQIILFDPETKETTIYDLIELREKEMKLQAETIDPITNVAHVRQYTLSKI